MLGSFQHYPDRIPRVLKSMDQMTAYFRSVIRKQRSHPREGLIHSFMTAEVQGDRLSEDEIIANTIITMTGGQETTTNLIGNGVLSLLRNPDQLAKLRDNPSLLPSGSRGTAALREPNPAHRPFGTARCRARRKTDL